ncbi:hypothetical protein B0I35DRAFT_412919 [Stachybotrys elegans]|uniref:F-box domain-containing protein n=1 Tax=Stachybotrys elegans TaxID=80388 RepID=A0A8K0WM66_9HYPO|nr:hypothetical protein B0I35DRAFT_412919 [Stachybotrys elegans]
MPIKSLSDLPIDVQHEICKNLCVHCSYPELLEYDRPLGTSNRLSREKALEHCKALSNLSKTSRHFHSIAHQYLPHYFHADTTHSSFVSFARALDTRPSFLLDMRELSVDQTLGDIQERLMDSVSYRFRDSAVPFPRPTLEWIAEIIRDKRHSETIDTLLTWLPKIQKLTLNVYEETDYGYSMMRRCMPTVKHLVLRSHDINWHGFSLDMVWQLLARVPLLERLDLHRCGKIPHSVPPFVHLRSLNITMAELSQRMLLNVAAWCPRLTSFKYLYYQSDYGSHREHAPLSPRQLVMQLWPCYRSLQYLEIEVGSWWRRNMLLQGDKITKRDLAPFRALKSLAIEEVCLDPTGTDATGLSEFLDELVPESTTSITISNMNPFLYRETSQVLEADDPFHPAYVYMVQGRRESKEGPWGLVLDKTAGGPASWLSQGQEMGLRRDLSTL